MNIRFCQFSQAQTCRNLSTTLNAMRFAFCVFLFLGCFLVLHIFVCWNLFVEKKLVSSFQVFVFMLCVCVCAVAPFVSCLLLGVQCTALEWHCVHDGARCIAFWILELSDIHFVGLHLGWNALKFIEIFIFYCCCHHLIYCRRFVCVCVCVWSVFPWISIFVHPHVHRHLRFIVRYESSTGVAMTTNHCATGQRSSAELYIGANSAAILCLLFGEFD